jgi:Flp pilus assembly secretin CpaC
MSKSDVSDLTNAPGALTGRSTKVKVVEDTAETQHFVLAVAPPNMAALSAEGLDNVAGDESGRGHISLAEIKVGRRAEPE